MITEFDEKVKYALFYADLGMAVFPCHSIRQGLCSCGKVCKKPGKHPRTPNGFKDATTDPEVIRQWWEKRPDANIGVRTGRESGIWVLDVDGQEGIEALAKLEAEWGPLP